MSDTKAPDRFVGLHAHSVFSVNDCVGYPAEHIDFALENGMDALALTDHGNASGFPNAYLRARDLQKSGQKWRSLYGCEFYVHPDLNDWGKGRAEAEKRKETMKFIKRHGMVEALARGIDVSGLEDYDPDASVATEGTDGVENEAASKTNKWLDPNKRRHHLVVLAKSSKGLENLFTLVSRGQKEGFYRFPRIDYRMLKEHSEGLIVSTACVAGPMAYDALSCFPDVQWDDIKPTSERFDEVQAKMRNTLDRLVDAVGTENLFLELQFNSLGAQHLTNQHLIHLSRQEGIKLVVTADSHYCRPDFWQSRELYKKLGWLNYEKYDPSMLPQSIDELKCELYPKNAEQMWDAYRKYCTEHSFYDDEEVKAAIERTHDIAWQLVGDVKPDTSVKLPSFVVPKGENDMDRLRRFANEGMERLGLSDKQEYEDRLVHELDVIERKDFARYFLTVKSIMDIAWEHMLCGPGRGSSAGSLVCYCLNITQLDPIKYGLLFERFVNEVRDELPDIDSDFAERDQLITLLKGRFGDDSVIPISNYNTFKLNSLMRDLSRFYGIPFDEVNTVMKQADGEVRKKVLTKGVDKNTYEMTYEQALEHSQVFREFIEENPEVGKHIDVLLKQIKTVGKHAGGIIVCDRIAERMPLIRVRGEMQSPWVEGMRVKELHHLGWVKIDALGLDTLRIVQRTIERILIDEGNESPSFADVKAWYDANLHPSKLDLDDQGVYDYVYGQGNWAGVFQVTSPGAKKFFLKGKPKSVTDIAALTSIFRPGPLAADVDDIYVKAKEDPESVTYEHPVLKDVLSNTYGTIVFQEQTLKIANKLGGLPPADCDRLRKVLMKKEVSTLGKRKSELDDLKSRFIAGAIERGASEHLASEIFQRLSYFSGYGFNFSHAISYAMDSYFCAWLLKHHQANWLCSYLESQIGNPDKRAHAMSELQSFGYSVADIDVNKVDRRWRVLSDRKLMPSLQTAKGVGDAAVDELLSLRPFASIEDMLWDRSGKYRLSKVNKKALDVLTKLGAFASFNQVGPGKLFDDYRHMHAVIVERNNELKKKNGREEFARIVEEARGIEPWTVQERIKFRLAIMGYFDIGMAIGDRIRTKLDELGVQSIDDHAGKQDLYWFVVVDGRNKRTRNGKEYQLLDVVGETGKRHRLFCWGAKHHVNFPRLVPAIAETSQSEFGFATQVSKLRFMNGR